MEGLRTPRKGLPDPKGLITEALGCPFQLCAPHHQIMRSWCPLSHTWQ